MTIKERDVVLVSTNDGNDTIIDMPVTRENCVEGLGRIRGTAYSVGDVALCAGSQSLQLICTASGTTSTNELDITGKAEGDTITDGTVVWKVVKRNYLGSDGALPIANGGTGATTARGALSNLGLATAVTGASISGKTITLTFADGTTKTLTTQDNGYHTGNATSIGGASATKPAVVVQSYNSGASWYRVWSDGWVEQGGVPNISITEDYQDITITLQKPMKNLNYHVSVTSVYYKGQFAPTIDNKTTTSFMLNDVVAYKSAYKPTWYACGMGA